MLFIRIIISNKKYFSRKIIIEKYFLSPSDSLLSGNHMLNVVDILTAKI